MAEADDDRRLAAAAAGGDRAALEALLERHFDLVHSVCRRVTADPDDALDATQEALVSVARRISTYDGRARFTTWLYRVATNAALDELRRRRRRPDPVEELPEVASSDGQGTFTGAVEARLDVDAALAGIQEEYRVAVVLRDLCDLDYEEIAEVVGVPIGTVRSRIARGRAALARRLGGNREPTSRRPTGEGAPEGGTRTGTTPVSEPAPGDGTREAHDV